MRASNHPVFTGLGRSLRNLYRYLETAAVT